MKDTKSSAAHIVKVAPRTKDILLYKLSNTFVCAKGAVRLALSAALFAVAVFCQGRTPGYVSGILFFLAFLNPVVTPICHWLASVKLAAELPANLFGFCSTRLTVNDGKKRLELEWDKLHQVVLSKKLLLIYVAPQAAFIVPKDQMGEERSNRSSCERKLCPVYHKVQKHLVIK